MAESWREACWKAEQELKEIKCHLSNVLDARAKLGIEYEQALMQIDELKGKIKFLEGQIEAYQYCMNCRR